MQIQTPYHMIIAGLQPARRFEMEKDRNDKNIGKKLDGRYEITELIGVSVEAVSKWERGVYEPTRDKVDMLYKVLD